MDVTPSRFAGPDPVKEYLSHRYTQIRYRDDDVTVTDQWLESPGGRYPTRDVGAVHVFQARRVDLTIRAAIAVAITFAIVRLWDRLDMDGWIGALAILVLALALVPFGRRRRPRCYLLTAEVYGCTRLLVADADQRRLREIARAVHEAHRAADTAENGDDAGAADATSTIT